MPTNPTPGLPPPFNGMSSDPLSSEHRHSGAEVIELGAANACPLCQALEIKSLKRKLAELQLTCDRMWFRNRAVVIMLHDVQKVVQAWMIACNDSVKKAPDHDSRDVVIGTLVEFSKVDTQLIDIMKKLIPGGENVEPGRETPVAGQDGHHQVPAA